MKPSFSHCFSDFKLFGVWSKYFLNHQTCKKISSLCWRCKIDFYWAFSWLLFVSVLWMNKYIYIYISNIEHGKNIETWDFTSNFLRYLFYFAAKRVFPNFQLRCWACGLAVFMVWHVLQVKCEGTTWRALGFNEGTGSGNKSEPRPGRLLKRNIADERMKPERRRFLCDVWDERTRVRLRVDGLWMMRGSRRAGGRVSVVFMWDTWFCYCKIFSCCICGIEALHNSLYIFVRQSSFLLCSKEII